jgi:uncharacterized protein YbjT (DUF2867 family)
MKVLVTGATGFTGSYVVPLLVRQGAHVRCLVRAASDTSRLAVAQVELVEGDLSDQSSLERAFRGADVLVNIALLRRSSTRLGRQAREGRSLSARRRSLRP